MTDKELILFIRENKKFPVAKWILVLKSIGLIFIAIFLLSVSGLFLFVLRRAEINPRAWTILLFIIPAVYYGTSILLNLKNEWISKSKFKEVFTNLSAEENLKWMTELLQANFRVKHISLDKNNHVIHVFTKISWRSWGDKITVLCDNNRVLLNSQKKKWSNLFGWSAKS